jgi:hypothetical protein
MSKISGGLVSVGYSTTVDGTVTTIAGVNPAQDSNFNVEKIINETTISRVSGGESVTLEINLFTFTDYATIQGFEENDTARFWHLTFGSGHVVTIETAIIPMATIQGKTDAREGRLAWQLQLEIHTPASVLDITDPA